jgi:hypothetical protein
MKPPVLPTEFCKIQPLRTIAFISYGLILYVGAAIGAGYLINSHLSAFVKLSILIPTWAIAQQGLHLLGVLS